MKKVGIIHYAYPPNIGGVEILIREHATLLSQMDFEVTVITGSGSETNQKIKLFVVPEIQSILRFNPTLYEKIVEKGVVDEQFKTLVKTIKEKMEPCLAPLDTIIVHNMMTLVHNLAFNYFLKEYVKLHPEKKFLFWTHDQTFIDGEKILEKKEGVNLDAELLDLLLKPVEGASYIAISKTFKELLCQKMKMPSEKIKVIYDGVNLQNFLEIDESIWKIVQEKQLLSFFPLILSPVNILARKNLDLAVEVISKLKPAYPKIKYVITGQPSTHRKDLGHFEALKQAINKLGLQENVLFLRELINRSLTDAEMHDLYDLTDIVFLFSKSENFGLPILEAAFAKTPAVVTDLKVFREIGGNNLTYFKPGSSAEKIAVLVDDMIKTNKQVLLKKTVTDKFNLENIIKNDLIPFL